MKTYDELISLVQDLETYVRDMSASSDDLRDLVNRADDWLQTIAMRTGVPLRETVDGVTVVVVMLPRTAETKNRWKVLVDRGDHMVLLGQAQRSEKVAVAKNFGALLDVWSKRIGMTVDDLYAACDALEPYVPAAKEVV